MLGFIFKFLLLFLILFISCALSVKWHVPCFCCFPRVDGGISGQLFSSMKDLRSLKIVEVFVCQEWSIIWGGWGFFMFKIQADWNNIIVESEKLLRCENTLLDGGMLSLSPYILAIVILMCLIYPLMIKSGCRGLLLWFRCCMSCFFFFKSE